MNELEYMSLEELCDLVKAAMAHIHTKLRVEQGFGYDQQCYVTSFGPEEYNVNMCIVDGRPGYQGLDWPRAWNV